MSAFALIQLILGIVEPALSASGVIPSAYQSLAAGILAAINAVKQDLTGSNGTTLSVNAVTLMAAIASGLQALQTAGALPASWAGAAVALADAASAGTAAYEASGTKVDPTQVQAIAPVA